jgi:hypothetical protein
MSQTQEQCWLIYDGRAMHGETDDAAIYQTCESLKEAQREVKETWPDGQIFVVDIIDGEGVNERGPLEGSAKIEVR